MLLKLLCIQKTESKQVIVGTLNTKTNSCVTLVPTEKACSSAQKTKMRLWLKAVTEPNSARHTAIAEWIRPESTENDGSVRFSDTGI